MDPRRLRHGEWIAGLSGAVLVVALFLDWYSAAAGAVTASAWEAFSVVDVVLLAAGLAGISLATATAGQRSPAVQQGISSLAVPVALLGAVLVLIRALLPPGGADGREIGLYLGIVAALGVLVGTWRSMSDQSFPHEVATQVDVTPLPAPKARSEPAADE